MADILKGRNSATFFSLLHYSNDRGMLTPLTMFIKNVVKAKMEGIFAITAALLVLFTAMMEPYISVGIAAALFVTLALYKFARRQKQERGVSKWLTDLEGRQQNEVS